MPEESSLDEDERLKEAIDLISKLSGSLLLKVVDAAAFEYVRRFSGSPESVVSVIKAVSSAVDASVWDLADQGVRDRQDG